jgi:hypothetical protein
MIDPVIGLFAETCMPAKEKCLYLRLPVASVSITGALPAPYQ